MAFRAALWRCPVLNGLRALNGLSGLRTSNGFSPAILFANGEQGLWLDPSDTSTLFQDNAGATPVTSFGQAVGLIRDKSGRGNHVPQATPTQRSIYARYPSRKARNLLTYSSDLSNAAWVKNGTTTVTSAGINTPLGNPAWLITYADTTNLPVANRALTAKAGDTYTISAWVKAGTAPNVIMRTAGATGGPTMTITPTSSWVRYSVTGTLTADNSSAFGLEFRGSTTSAGTVIVGDVQLEITSAASAYQKVTTAGAFSEPLYRNTAVASGDPTNLTYWPATVLGSGITETTIARGIDTDGLPYADVRWSGIATGTTHTGPYVSDLIPVGAGETYTASFIARMIGGSTAGVTGIRAVMNELTSGVFLASSASASSVAATDTVMSVTATQTTGNQFRPFAQLLFTNGATIDVTFRVKALQYEQGTERTAYQVNTSAYDVTEIGKPSMVGLKWDGVDDYMTTPVITHASDKVQFWAGVVKLSDAARGTVFIMSSGGRVSLEAPGATLSGYSSTDGGTALAGATLTTVPAPNVSVISVTADIAVPSIVMRRNGASAASSSATMGTGNFPSGVAMTIGGGAAGINPLNGFMTSLIVRFGPNLPAERIAAIDQWVNSRMAAF